ncbi:uncharacterized protein LOC112179734 isoform X2 [Rosa chinensis]|uniref:uncharacterized protein LOC112179734 isoform X2 n=1 Tax=Rosa chinensis TaxID=74649 RepID=UPI001AD8BFD2|nr:uncharacterized protein LOC112179734 isoform X2 [Rosa chinensis]XP_040366816.1 uncharacterized protein LOC112179734 isoform X2 [Rosa chinensis]XP_040366817.1 uncharacterized protein LOC112179734 isoform X2 [Rosa chinensis]
MNKQLYLLLVLRTTKLLDEEIEEDEMFWNQEALKEEEEDDNYEVELKVTDLFDNDFVKDFLSWIERCCDLVLKHLSVMQKQSHGAKSMKMKRETAAKDKEAAAAKVDADKKNRIINSSKNLLLIAGGDKSIFNVWLHEIY